MYDKVVRFLNQERIMELKASLFWKLKLWDLLPKKIKTIRNEAAFKKAIKMVSK